MLRLSVSAGLCFGSHSARLEEDAAPPRLALPWAPGRRQTPSSGTTAPGPRPSASASMHRAADKRMVAVDSAAGAAQKMKRTKLQALRSLRRRLQSWLSHEKCVLDPQDRWRSCPALQAYSF